jgi:hypothetical protein
MARDKKVESGSSPGCCWALGRATIRADVPFELRAVLAL